MSRIVIKLVKVAIIACAVALVVRLAGPKIRERMERKFEEASDDFPPKWMFRNVAAIRENTERILEVLTKGASEADAA